MSVGNPFPSEIPDGAENPYVSPKPIGAMEKGLEARTSLEYTRMFTFAFESPNWFMNLLFIAICQFIPLIGAIIVIGYQFEIVEALYRSPKGRYPDFDFNFFVDYLKRGLWPFLVAVVASLVIVPVIIIMMMVVVGGGAAAAAANGNQPEAGASIVGFSMFLMVPIMIGLGVVMNLLIIPMQIRSGLTQDFGSAFDFAYIKQFVASVWKETILGLLFLMLVALGATFVGFLMCIVGIYLTLGVVMLAQAHFHYQLYELYLSRGGHPFPLLPKQPLRKFA